jgi:hypothetical protein
MQNLLLKIPYKFKKSYGGAPEPQTTQDAPWLHGPSLKIVILAIKDFFLINPVVSVLLLFASLH